jgi:hypothetical protein
VGGKNYFSSDVGENYVRAFMDSVFNFEIIASRNRLLKEPDAKIFMVPVIV